MGEVKIRPDKKSATCNHNDKDDIQKHTLLFVGEDMREVKKFARGEEFPASLKPQSVIEPRADKIHA